MKFIKYIYEEFTDCFGKFNDDRKLFGFWEALGWDIQGVYNHRIGWWIRKIIKIAQWIPVLWHDEDWENTYILELLKYKLARVKKEIIKGYGDDKEWKEPRSAEIDSAIASIDRILKDEFVEEEREAHKIKYGEINWLSGPEKLINGNKLHEMIIYYDKVKDGINILFEEF